MPKILSSDDINARTTLLGYHFTKKHTSPTKRESHAHHVFWLIENAPEAKILGLPYCKIYSFPDSDNYNHGKELWLKHLESKTVKSSILINAANYPLLDDPSLAKDALTRGGQLNPNDPQWPARLGRLGTLSLVRVQSKKKRLKITGETLLHYQRAYELATDEVTRDPILKDLAKTALAADKLDDAKTHAEKMLNQKTDDWNSGHNIHHGNLILGRIAPATGDIKTARQRLLDAGRTKGSPQLDSFGPNMTLAKELLAVNETEVVLEYFELCRKFWDFGTVQLDQSS